MIKRHEFVGYKVGRYYYFNPNEALRFEIDGEFKLLSDLPINVQCQLKPSLNRFDEDGNAITPDSLYEYLDDQTTGIRIMRRIYNVQPCTPEEAQIECLRRCGINPDPECIREYLEDGCFHSVTGSDGKQYMYFNDNYRHICALCIENMAALTPIEIHDLIDKTAYTIYN